MTSSRARRAAHASWNSCPSRDALTLSIGGALWRCFTRTIEAVALEKVVPLRCLNDGAASTPAVLGTHDDSYVAAECVQETKQPLD